MQILPKTNCRQELQCKYDVATVDRLDDFLSLPHADHDHDALLPGKREEVDVVADLIRFDKLLGLV